MENWEWCKNGIQQRLSSWQDGVSGTNCPIEPGKNWTYVFQVKDQIGSFIYFPSTNFQKAARGCGPIRVNNRDVILVHFLNHKPNLIFSSGTGFTVTIRTLIQRKSVVGSCGGVLDGALMNGKGPYGHPEVITINGMFPGPLINATTNDMVHVNVFDNLGEPLLLTWNAIQQRLNSWQDGVSGTNCPIEPGKNWTYVFQVKDQIGSFIYFPSTNFQNAVGGCGPIRVNNRDVILVPFLNHKPNLIFSSGTSFKVTIRVVRTLIQRKSVVGSYGGVLDGALMNGKGPYGHPEVITINGMFPGPLINATTNDMVHVNVFDNLDEPLLLTWNAIQQRLNSWQDGVSGTNCPIEPGKNWTYVFQVKDQIGSFIYFPSTNFQNAVGGCGPIRVNNRDVILVPFLNHKPNLIFSSGTSFKVTIRTLIQRKSVVGSCGGVLDGALMNGKGPYGHPE
ncbi:unnamed protein product [Camellia sinensis]